MAEPYPMAHNFEKLISARMSAPTGGYMMNPLQQREIMLKEDSEKRRAELIAKAAGSGNESVKHIAKKWLSV